MKEKQKPIPRIYKNFGREIKFLRKLNSMTQADLAKKVGMHREAIVVIESGKYGNVNLVQLEKFAKAFGISTIEMTAVTLGVNDQKYAL